MSENGLAGLGCNLIVPDEDKKDLKLRFRGSSNQRIIDVKESLKENKVVEFKLK